MVDLFLTQACDQQFKSWLKQHPHGFYLNERIVGNINRGAGNMIMHKVGCHHLGDGAGIISTTYAKVASDVKENLLAWAIDHGLKVDICRSCKPD